MVRGALDWHAMTSALLKSISGCLPLSVGAKWD